MSLSELPHELILIIAQALDQSDLNSLCQTSTLFYRLLDPCLYRLNVQCYESSALIWAAEHGQLRTFKKLLSAGADLPCEPDSPRIVPVVPRSGRRKVLSARRSWLPLRRQHPIHVAAKHGQETILDFLLERGVNPNFMDYDNYTPLEFATEYGTVGVVKKLLAHGANPTLVDERSMCEMSGPRPVWFAAKRGELEMTEVLLEHIATNYPHESAMHHENAINGAAFGGHLDVVELVLNRGCAIDAMDPSSNPPNLTPLYYAALQGHVSIVRYLIERGADICLNVDALDWIRRNHHDGVIAALLEGCRRIPDESRRRDAEAVLKGEKDSISIWRRIHTGGEMLKV